jgi:dihydrodipicolinate synthase/N-acetylneuraminate lyase
MQPETIVRLSSISNIIGVKEATGDLTRIEKLRAEVPADFAIYSGDDATAREAMLLGADGDISVTANVAPKAMHEMCQAALNKDANAAAKIDANLSGLHKSLFVESNPIPVKWALGAMGMMGFGIRLPLTRLSAHAEAPVRDALAQAGIETK